MSKFNKEEQVKIAELIDNHTNSIERSKNRLEGDKIPDRNIPTIYWNLGRKYRIVGCLYIPEGNIDVAREKFLQSAKYFTTAEKKARDRPPYANQFRRIPFTLAEGIYSAALAGDQTYQQSLADRIIELQSDQLNPEDDIDPDDFDKDKYYLAQCLGQAVSGSVSQQSLNKLSRINQNKSTYTSLYGRGIIKFAEGIQNKEVALIRDGIKSLIEYHEQDLNDENIVELIMAPEATAIYIIARQKNYDVEINNEFIPNRLVGAVTDDP